MRGVTATVRAARSMTPLAVGVMVAVVIVDIVAGGSRIAGWVALVAAAVQFGRLAQWQGHRTLREPIVWVLHLAYLWIPIGLLLKGMALLGIAGGAVGWLHALTAGTIATMIFGVMTRVSLGHTGRPLVLPRGVAAAYVPLTGAALLRVSGAVLPVVDYAWTIAASAGLWASAFAVFLWQYGPILWRPRPTTVVEPGVRGSAPRAGEAVLSASASSWAWQLCRLQSKGDGVLAAGRRWFVPAGSR
jgi:uncharacterized protein involved in response to NO